MAVHLANLQNLNTYSYVLNNPLKYVDPDGELFTEFLAGGQTWSNYVADVGAGGQYLYNSSSAWRGALDHAYVTGAVIGVSGGLASFGGDGS